MTHIIKCNKGWQWLFIVVLLGVFTLPTQAAVPDNVDYQGYLTDSGGSPINGTVFINFSLYNVDSGGIALWSDIRSVTVSNGLFNVKLGGSGSPFPAGLFDDPLWLGIDVAGDGEMTPRIEISSAGFAHKADDALTLEGQTAGSLDQSAHVTDTSNPHSVTAVQVGAASSAAFTLHTADPSAHHSKTTSFTDLTDQATDAQLPATIARDAEIMPTVLANDGPGSSLNADLLDGLNSTAFMSSGTDYWVNISGDTMTGNLIVLSTFQAAWEPPTNNINPVATFRTTGATNSAGAIRLQNTNNNNFNIGITQNDHFAINYNSNISQFSDLLRITPTGDIGIGTITPSEKLTVAGTIESTSGGVKFPDGSLQTTAASGSLYSKVAVVAQSGGDYNSPLAAMTDLANWCGTPSATNPCLLRIMPGIYDLGNNGLTMQSYVDIEGSGENTTIITSTHSSGSADANSATVSGADHAEIRFLSVENRGGSTYALAIYNNAASPKITHVTATASGGTNSYGVYNLGYPTFPTMMNVTVTAFGGSSTIGVYNGDASPTMINVTATAREGTATNIGVSNGSDTSPIMTNVTAEASGTGSVNTGVFNIGNPTMSNVTATASRGTTNYGVYNDGSSPVIKNSSISGTTNSIYNSSGSTAKVGATMLDGSVSGSGFTCVGAYDENFVALSTGCL